jgi:hypothetical protein
MGGSSGMHGSYENLLNILDRNREGQRQLVGPRHG